MVWLTAVQVAIGSLWILRNPKAIDAGTRENLPALIRKIESEGTWRTLRAPIFVVIVSFLLLLFTTQKDLLTLTTGFAAAMTTGLPVLVNFFGMFTQRRLETAAKLR